MKTILILLAALAALPCLASKAETKNTPAGARPRVEPLPFPDGPAPAAEPVLGEVEVKVGALDPKIGRYPPRLQDAAERLAVYREWSAAVLAAEALRRKEGDSERLACALAALYRQGHNMDVKDCGRRALETIEAALAAYPESVPVNWQASYLYLQIAPKFAPAGEKALLKLRALLGTERNLEVERGLVFAYLYQDRVPEARQQIDRCLEISPQDRMLLQFKEALKNGNLQRVEAK